MARTGENIEEAEEFEDYEKSADLEETDEDGFDYDGWRMHRYDKYNGRLTEDIAVCKFEALIRKIAKRYTGGGAEYDDLVQAGMEAAATALRGHEDDEGVLRYLQIKIVGGIQDAAKKFRRQARFSKVPFDVIAETSGISEEECFGDWKSREKTMFEKISVCLTEEEMRVTWLLYNGISKRQIAQMLQISHTAAGKRADKIRQKLEPLRSWLKDMAELKCIEFPE